jgi:hypothetical protein
MLDMLVQGLLKVDKVNAGLITKESLKPFEEEVLKEQLKFKRLIEARFKFFPATALARMSKIDDGNFFKKNITKMKMYFKPWTPTFLDPVDSLNMNNIQIAYLNEIMAHGLKAKHILEALGEHPKLDPKVIKIYNNMDLSNVSEKNKEQVTKLQQQIKELLEVKSTK